MQRKQSSRQNSFVRPRKPPRLARRYQTASSASGSQQDWNLLNQIIDIAQRRHGLAIDLTGTNVLVVDDVMTTGATLDELARTLKAHGASRVENRVLARALKD